MSKNITKFKENKTIGSQLITYQNRRLNKIIDNLMSELGDSTDTGTDLTLNGTAEYDIDLEFSGNTEQASTTGKNLIPTQISLWEQGTIANGNNSTSTTRIRTADYYPIENDKDYHISIQGNDYCFTNIWLYDTNKSVVGQYYDVSSSINGATNQTINIPSSEMSNIAYMRVVLRNKTGSATITPNELQTIKPQIELGSTATEFEPYTNGVSPNPEYPQDIQVVKGNNELKIENKNWFVANWVRGYLTAEGGMWYSAAGPQSLATLNYIKVNPGTEYKLSYSYGRKATGANILYISEYNINRTHIKRNNNKTTLVTTNDTQYIRISWYQVKNGTSIIETNASTPELYIKDIQLELGSTATSYVPHKEQTYPITLPTGMFMAKIETYEDKIQGNIDNWYIPNKILKIDSYNGETITTPYISSTGGLDIGATVYYVGTETLSITDTTLIEQLNNIKQAYTYQGQTNISQTNEDLPFIITADFKLSNLSRIEALENALETVSSRVDLLEE